jgi:hypothetical protein
VASSLSRSHSLTHSHSLTLSLATRVHGSRTKRAWSHWSSAWPRFTPPTKARPPATRAEAVSLSLSVPSVPSVHAISVCVCVWPDQVVALRTELARAMEVSARLKKAMAAAPAASDRQPSTTAAALLRASPSKPSLKARLPRVGDRVISHWYRLGGCTSRRRESAGRLTGAVPRSRPGSIGSSSRPASRPLIRTTSPTRSTLTTGIPPTECRSAALPMLCARSSLSHTRPRLFLARPSPPESGACGPGRSPRRGRHRRRLHGHVPARCALPPGESRTWPHSDSRQTRAVA